MGQEIRRGFMDKTIGVADVKVIEHRPHCMRHEGAIGGIHNEKYDSYYCAECNRWLEAACSCRGDSCEYFPGRPILPQGVI